MTKRRGGGDPNQLPIFGHTAVKEAIEEEKEAERAKELASAERLARISRAVSKIQDEKAGVKFRVRVYPFDKHSKYEQVKSSEIDMNEYVEKLRSWLKYKPRPIHILIERNDVVWMLLSLESPKASTWEEESLH